MKCITAAAVAVLVANIAAAAGDPKADVSKADRALIQRSNASAQVMQRAPKMSAGERKKLDDLVRGSLAATKAGDGAVAARQIEEVRSMAKDNSGAGNDTSPFESCGDTCQHHLGDGEPEKYAVCYYACVIRGGDAAALRTRPGLPGGSDDKIKR